MLRRSVHRGGPEVTVVRSIDANDPTRTYGAGLLVQSGSLLELLEQRLRLLQVRRVETLGKPAVDRREEFAGFVALASVAPESGEAGGGAQLPEVRALPPRNGDRLVKTLFRRLKITDTDEQFAANTMHVSLGPAFLVCLNLERSIVELLKPLTQPACLAKSFRKRGEKHRDSGDGPNRLIGVHRFRDQRDGLVRTT